MDNARQRLYTTMPKLKKTQKRRQEIVQAAATHLVEHGLHNSSLRAIADTVGISDRMIMYYFATKEDLVAEALIVIGDSLAMGMDQAVPKGNLSPPQALKALREAMATREARAVLRLWFEIIGLAMRGQQPYRDAAALLLSRSETQIRGKLRSGQKHRAREVLSALEGQVMVSLLVE